MMTFSGDAKKSPHFAYPGKSRFDAKEKSPCRIQEISVVISWLRRAGRMDQS
jgi:hypothetical protein